MVVVKSPSHKHALFVRRLDVHDGIAGGAMDRDSYEVRGGLGTGAEFPMKWL
jgi:hypothetical protein